MNYQRLTALLRFAGLPAGVALLLISCATDSRPVSAPLEMPGAHYAGNAACQDCHAELVREFPASPHGRFDHEKSALPGQTGCESCHGPGSRHIASGGGAQFIINPGKDPAACFQCHLDVRGAFSLPQHHPVIEGRMNCAQCHDPHGGDVFKPAGGPAMTHDDESCDQCHEAQTRPFVFAHDAMREGCVTCHSPHGSINQKLLVASDPNLCLRCHAQTQTMTRKIYIGDTDHTTFLQLGTCWSSGCHTSIHGSNVDPRLRY